MAEKSAPRQAPRHFPLPLVLEQARLLVARAPEETLFQRELWAFRERRREGAGISEQAAQLVADWPEPEEVHETGEARGLPAKGPRDFVFQAGDGWMLPAAM